MIFEDIQGMVLIHEFGFYTDGKALYP